METSNEFEQECESIWEEFLKQWPIERLKTMSLEEYTNLKSDTDDYFCHWIERKTQKLGSIQGGSSGKFGIYKAASDTTKLKAGEVTENGYVWWEKLGDSPQSVFEKIKESVVSIAENAARGTFTDDLREYPGSAIQMKIRFLYQNYPYRLLPINSRKLLDALSQKYLNRPCKRGLEMIETNLELRKVHGHESNVFTTMLTLCNEVDKPLQTSETRRYWAGGTTQGDANMAEEFIERNEWNSGFTKETAKRHSAGRLFLENFPQIKVGDWFAMKGYGGRAQLKIYYVGEVIGKDEDNFSISLKPLPEIKLFRDKAPTKGGKGSWQGTTLVDVVDPIAIEKVFGVSVSKQMKQQTMKFDLPLNQILYGPPGTGKTYTLRSDYFPLFSDTEASQTKEEFTNEMVAKLSWWEVMTVVMLDLKTANVGEILAHPICQSKVSLSDNKNPRAAIWAQLQSHTKNDCPNVNYTKRLEPQLFWKDENSIWSIDLELTS